VKFSSIRSGIAIMIALLAILGFSTGTYAQQKGAPPPPNVPKVNPKEQADYKALLAATDPDKKIQLGKDFLQKYPTSLYISAVYDHLVNAYYAKQDWDSFYATADQAIAKDPDDVDTLALVGWVIPHVYRPDDPDHEKKLDRAETYEKHALEVLPNVTKPASLTDDQFAMAKAQREVQIHSGLGLVYFRQMDYDNAAKELQLATKDPDADATDLYVLGISLQNLKRNSDAAAAFQKCSAIPGGLQDRCKQSAESVK
jgi:tetratricopeptide (TPR) repeat protein